ncbi:MAG TPA: hypothetical protein VH353_11660 [Caulobacteraceae bacterium]|jgi:hypothetical protein|nr:hypothetical protein [Caulobacteraceae bacterium]
MRRTIRLQPRFATVFVMLMLAACSPRKSGTLAEDRDHRLPSNALDQGIGSGIGDPTTCVLIADKTTGKVLYQYGELFNCVRGLPACDRPGVLSARQALAFAKLPEGRETSCPSVPDGSRMVGWAQGSVGSKSPNLVYSAVMEGQKALPGHEMAARLSDAFQNAGL